MYTFEAIFCIDVCCNFILTYEVYSPEKGKQTIKKVSTIAWHYLTGNFIKDLLPLCPF